MSDYNFEDNANIAVFGSTGGIGSAILKELEEDPKVNQIYAFSRSGQDDSECGKTISKSFDLRDETSIEKAAEIVESNLDMVFVATGVLHEDDVLEPEKAIRDLTPEQLKFSYEINTIGPALIGKHFLPKMRSDRKSVFAVLSARVGSISDNNDIGGWYAYRASKAALNMIVKNFSIELGRKNKHLVVTGLQPGTVDTNLSDPFQHFVKDDHIFTPQFAATSLLATLDKLSASESGRLFDWQGEEFQP